MQWMVVFLVNLFSVTHQPDRAPKSVFAVNNGQVFMSRVIINQAGIIKLIITGEGKHSNYIQRQHGIRMRLMTSEFEVDGIRPGQGRTCITHQLMHSDDVNGVLRIRMEGGSDGRYRCI
ncbi:phage tail tip fiber protein [Pseudomonas muyukensis]|uniref:phage tail tip fiber protein n=1 Tax=Pseudomonas muyukensis TaxID=2842357 RepID=UPI003F5ABBA6